MFYLTTHSTLYSFYLWLYDIRHILKDHSDSKSRKPLSPLHGLFSISSKGYFYMHYPTDNIAHTIAFVLHQLWITGWNQKTTFYMAEQQ